MENENYFMSEQLSLNIDMPCTSPPPRPLRSSDEVTNKLVDQFFDKVINWMGITSNSGYTKSDYDAIRKDMFKVFSFYGDEDGYELAKEFDSRGWETNRELVDLLDNVFWTKRNIYNTLISEWVTKFDIKPTLALGTRVSIENPRVQQYGKMVEGEIIDVSLDRAQYTIYCESQGHVRFGTGTRGHVVDFEKVKAL